MTGIAQNASTKNKMCEKCVYLDLPLCHDRLLATWPLTSVGEFEESPRVWRNSGSPGSAARDEGIAADHSQIQRMWLQVLVIFK